MLPWIDALRGLAILMVLANHVALVVPGLSAPVLALARFGQMGVQLFFVVSAYTLCLSWQQRRRDESPSALRFLVRRFFRIAPLYWLGVALFTTLHVLLPDPSGPDPFTWSNVLANLCFVHGFIPQAQNSIVPGGWSIGTEMAFYVLFPLLHAGCCNGSGAKTAAAAVLALGLSLAVPSAPVANNSFAYYHLLNQLPVFLIGMALFQWHRDGAVRIGLMASLALVGAAGLAMALLWRSGWPSAFRAVPPAAGLAFAAAAHAASRLHLPWRAPAVVLQAFGRASYAIYVVHIVFAWHGLRAVAAAVPLRGDVAYAIALLLVAALSFVAAQWLGRWVERPGIACGRRLLAAQFWPRSAGAR